MLYPRINCHRWSEAADIATDLARASVAFVLRANAGECSIEILSQVPAELWRELETRS